MHISLSTIWNLRINAIWHVGVIEGAEKLDQIIWGGEKSMKRKDWELMGHTDTDIAAALKVNKYVYAEYQFFC